MAFDRLRQRMEIDEAAQLANQSLQIQDLIERFRVERDQYRFALGRSVMLSVRTLTWFAEEPLMLAGIVSLEPHIHQRLHARNNEARTEIIKQEVTTSGNEILWPHVVPL